jgi:acyl-CoA dehydrogenase
VNVGKFNLCSASIGMAEHAFYEAITHAQNRILYGNPVTEFTHVRTNFVDAYSRLIAMKLFSQRSVDYFRAASLDDRRYLLFNPIVKMKVTGQGEKVVALLHEVIAARGFEQETYFEMGIRDIGMLPKLEGTEHVNMALIIKFVKNYFFEPVDYPEIDQQYAARDDAYLFNQKTGGLAGVRFPDYRIAYREVGSPNVQLFKSQVELFRKLLITAPPTREQVANIDYMLSAGELFTLAVYAQLILENARIHAVSSELLEQIFTLLVQDYSRAALQMVVGFNNSPEQEALYREMLKKPVVDAAGFEKIWQDEVYVLKDAYVINE